MHGAARASGADAFVEGDAPVEAEDVCGGFAEGGEERGGVYAEVDDGDAEGLDAGDELGGGGEAVLAVVCDGERSGPGVEDLDDIGSGGDLLRGVVDDDGNELFHEERPGTIGGVHEFFCFDVVSRAGAFDHVAGEGERGAAEADDAELVAVWSWCGEVFGDFFDGL